MFGALFIVGGILGSAGFGIYVETKKAYKLSVNLICLFSCIFTVLSYFFMPMEKAWLISLMCFFQGASMVPIMAVSFDFGVELTYPVGESFSTGVLLSSGQIFGILYTILAS